MDMGKRKRSEAELQEDEARLLRELKRRRTDVEDRLNHHKQLEEKSRKSIRDIGTKLAEGTIRPERVDLHRQMYDDFVRLLPTVSQIVEELNEEFHNCSSLIQEMESATATDASTSSPTRCVDDSATAASKADEKPKEN